MPDERAASADRVTALETALRGFAERKTDAVINPTVGITFDSLGEAYDFYNLHSWECGFGIRYGKSRTNVKGAKCMQELVCNCSGKPKGKNTSSCRCQCPALIRLLRTDDQGWFICESRSSHNHKMLNTYTEKLHFPSHRHVDKYTRELVAQLRENNVNLAKVYSIIGTFFGRVENVPFTKRCLRTLSGKISAEPADDDIRRTMELLAEMKENDGEFDYTVRMDVEGRIRTLIWTNGRSKLQYHHFRDVITFDTTYKSNIYDTPYGLFVGANNHFQTIIFAGVLMRDEKIESFKWVFREFTKLMGGKKPQTILTDEAKAMEVAIEEVFPQTTHMLCKWHVLRKAKESLGTHYTKRSDFRCEFHRLVHDMLTVDEFEQAWKILLAKYRMESNTFLSQIYKLRKKWAKQYFSGTFCAKQTSTQRSESANHMLKGYVPPACPMNLFVKQYGMLQLDREQEEAFQEKRSRLGGFVLKSNLPIEIHASNIYIRRMFEMFSDILYEAGSYLVDEIIPKRKYVARHVNTSMREKWLNVVYDVEVSEDGGVYTCECGLFEHMGMICCHALKVMIVLGITEIPRFHVMKRWTVKARDNLSDHLRHYKKDMGPSDAPSFRQSALYKTAMEVVQMGDSNAEAFDFVMNCLLEAKSKAAAFCE